jgi:phage terminase Nu1 subunit (DNA packaging protein)
VEERISGLKDKIDFKEKTEVLDKRLNICKRNTQELSDSDKRQNLQIIKEGEEVQAKAVRNITNKIIAEISQILRKSCPFRYRKPPEHQADLTKIEPICGIL